MAVVNVIINRVKYEDYFEDDIIGVIFEKNQFSPIENGYIYEVKPSSETIEAVADALAGKVVIPEGVLYFCMSYVAENSWFSTRVKWGEIGDHHFYY